MQHIGFEPTLFENGLISWEQRDRLRPRRRSQVGPVPAIAGSKLRGTRHGGVFLLILRRLFPFFDHPHEIR
jgi:hypothetical protein